MMLLRLFNFNRWLFLVAFLILTLALLFYKDYNRSQAPAEDSAAREMMSVSRADASAEAKPSINPAIAKHGYHWGGALNSVALDGADFFNPARNHEFNATIEDALKKYIVDLNARSFLPLITADLTEILSLDEGQSVVYLQFIEHPTDSQRAQLTDLGVELLAYVSGYAWLARGAPEAFKAARRLDFTRALARIDPRDKLLPAIFAGHRPPYAQTLDGRARFMLLALPGARLDDLAQAIKRQPALSGVEARSASASVLGPRFEVIAAHAVIETLAALPVVRFIEFASPPVASRDTITDNSSNIWQVRDNPPNLTGNGIKVAIREMGNPSAHQDFNSRLTRVDTNGSNDPNEISHSTAVVGQVGSAGVVAPTAKGVAPEVSMWLYSLVDGNFATTDIVVAGSQGARISNHSYGPNVTAWGDYQTDSATWDQAMRDHNLIGMFAGNEESGATYKHIDYFVGAKNTICVGATNSAARAGPPAADGIASFSQWGPMNDGRVKPDLVAFGEGVTLCNGTNGATIYSGTSFATPAVTGIAALVFQQYKAKIGSEPSASLIKALLCNSATDLGPVGPDAQYGFGIVNAQAAIDTINLQTAPATGPFYEGIIKDQEQRSFAVDVQTNTLLKATLCWLDVAGNPSSTNALVNDLDIELKSPNGTTFYPFSLDPSNPSAAATATGRNTADPIEQVIVSAPALGIWTVTIKGTSIPNGPQSFAVCLNKPKDPSLQAVITASPTEGGAPLTVSFSANDSIGNIVSYAWNFGDGSPVNSSANTSHTYTALGSYTVTLSITDTKGKHSDAIVIIIVSKRIASVFPLKAMSQLGFQCSRCNKLQFTLIIPELVLTPQQWRNDIKGGLLKDKTFDVTVGKTKFPQFKLNAQGKFISKNQSLILNRPQGKLTIQFNGNPDLPTIFSQFGMTEDPNSSGIHELPVQVETEDAIYQATFKLLYKNTRGVNAKGITNY